MKQLRSVFLSLVTIFLQKFGEKLMSGGGHDIYKYGKKSMKKIKTRYSNYGFINTRVKPL